MNTKAVVLAGGMGTRLRPLTDHIPKPLAPIGDESAVSVVLNMLERSGVSDAVLTLMYKGEMIEKELGASHGGISLSYIYEKDALGTAGCVKNAEAHLRGCGTFIVASGDAVCDLDLAPALSYHRQTDALATLILTKREDAGEYGIVLGNFDSDGRGVITSFIEKPPYAMAYSDLVNTGIYILDEKVLELIPEKEKYDFARDLFPTLIGKGLFGYSAGGYWCDVGDIGAYKKCLYDAAAGRIRTAQKCRISGDGNIIGKSCRIAESAKVSNSILHAGVTVCENCVISDSILCENALVEENSEIRSGSVLGAGSVVCAGSSIAGAKITEGSIAVPNSKIEEEIEKTLPLYRGKLEGVDKNDIPFLGAAILSIPDVKRVGIMWSEPRSHAADALLNTLGERAVSLGEGYPELASFGARELELSFVIYSDKFGHLTFFDRDGVPISHELERKIVSNFKKHEPKKAENAPEDLSDSLLCAYLAELHECAKGISLSDVSVSISDTARTPPLSHALRNLGVLPRKNRDDGYHITFSEAGGVSALGEYKSGKYFEIGTSHVAALLLLLEARPAERIALPFGAPKILDAVLESVGAIPDRYTENEASESHSQKNIKFPIFDSAAAVISLLCHLKKNESSLEDECKKLPEFVFVRKTVKTADKTSDALMRTMMEAGAEIGDGIRIGFSHGSLAFTPSSKNEAIISCDAEDEEEADRIISAITERYSLN